MEIGKAPIELATDQDLARLEAAFQHDLPRQYRDFMKTFGAMPFNIIGWAKLMVTTTIGSQSVRRAAAIEAIAA